MRNFFVDLCKLGYCERMNEFQCNRLNINIQWNSHNFTLNNRTHATVTFFLMFYYKANIVLKYHPIYPICM